MWFHVCFFLWLLLMSLLLQNAGINNVSKWYVEPELSNVAIPYLYHQWERGMRTLLQKPPQVGQ